MRKNRVNLGSFIKGRRFSPKLIGATIIILLASCLIIGYIWKVLSTSDYFTIKDVITRESNIVDLSFLLDKNIFSVDLGKEAGYILETFPNYNKIRLIRVLPNRIFVDFIKRKPVALVKLYRYFALDKEGVLFYGSDEPQELELPLILGLETKIFGPRPGKKYNIKEILLALNIIREGKRNRVLKDYKIKRINVANPTTASILITLTPKTPDYTSIQTIRGLEGLEVRLGEDNIKNKIIILAGLLGQAKNELANIKYIDLRFKEPVIKFKDAK